MADLIEIGFKVDTRNLNRARDTIQDFSKRSQTGIETTDRAMRRLQQTIGALAASFVVFGTIDTIRTLNEYVDVYTNLNSQIRLVTNSQDELNRTYEELRGISQDTLTGLEATTRLYSNLIRSTKDLGLSQAQVAQLTKTTNQLFLISGATAKETSAALRQLTQGLAAGALRGDEFNSVAENAPRIMDLLAEKLQMNRGELREFAATGGITAEIFANAILDSAEATDKLAQQVEVTFEKKLQVAKDNMMDFVGTHETLNDLNRELGDSILFLSENLDALEVALGAAAAAMLIRFVPAMYAGLIAVGALSGSVSIFITQLAAVIAPFTPLIAVIGAAVAAFTTYKAVTQEATLEMERQREELGHFKQAYEELNDDDLFKVYQANMRTNAHLLDEIAEAEARRDNSSNVFSYNKEVALIEELNAQLDQNRAKLNLVGDETKKRNNAVKNLYAEELKLIEAWEEEQKLLDEQADTLEKLVGSIDPLARKISDIEGKQAKLNDAFAFGGMSFAMYAKLSTILKHELQEVQDEIDGTTARQKQFNEAMKVWLDKQEEAKQARTEMLLVTQQAANELHMEKLAAEAAAEGTDAARISVELLAFQQQLWASGVNPAVIEGLVKQKKTILELEASTKKAVDIQKELNDISESINIGFDRIGSSFINTGNGIIDTFQEASTVMGEFVDRMDDIADNRERLLALQNSGKLTLEQELQVKQDLAKLEEQSVSAQMQGIGNLLGASKQFFSENSKAREALHRAEVAFTAIELAMTLQRSLAKAKEAIAGAFAAPFPINFAAGAAMVAVMAGLLGGGVGAPGATPNLNSGRGTVLGDTEAQSGSIGNSQELYEDIQLDQLAELRGIHRSMSNLGQAINQLTRNILGAGGLDTSFVGDLSESANGGLVRKFLDSMLLNELPLIGDLFSGLVGGLFGSTKQSVTDQGISITAQSLKDIVDSGDILAQTFATIHTKTKRLFGLSSSSSTRTEFGALDGDFTGQVARIITSMTDSLLAAGEQLGIGLVSMADGTLLSLEDALAHFDFGGFNISFQDKTGEEIEKELEAVFGSVGDDIANFLFPTLRQYQEINEGMFETVLRVTKETIILQNALEKLGSNFTTIATIPIGQAIIDAIGGLENFEDAFAQFMDNFYSEQEQLDFLVSDLTAVFDSLNLEMPTTLEGFRELVEATVGMGTEGAETLALLLQVNDAFSDMVSRLEEINQAAQDFTAQALNLFQFFGLNNDVFDNFRSGFSSETAKVFDQAIEQLVTAFGSSGEVVNAIQSFASNFLDMSDQVELANREVFAGFFDLRDRLQDGDLTDSYQDFNRLTNSLYNFTGSSEELSQAFADLVTGVTAEDINAGMLEGLLNLSPVVADFVNILQQQEQATQAAIEAEQALQEERDNRTLDLQIQLLRTQGAEIEAVALERAREIEALQEYDEQNQTNLANIQSLIYLQEDYNAALEQQQEVLTGALNSVRAAIEAEKNVLLNLVNDLESVSNRVGSGLRRIQVNQQGDFEVARRELDAALIAARMGNFEPASQLDINTLTANNTDSFSTRAEFNVSQAKIAEALKEIEELSEDQLSEHELEILRLDGILESVEDQANTLLGIEQDQVQQLINDEQYAAALDLALAEFINEAVSMNGLLALQDANAESNFANLIQLQADLISAGDLNAATLITVANEGNGLLSLIADVMNTSVAELLAASDATGNSILELADLQQALIDANIVNFTTLTQLTDLQRQQIVDHLNSLTDVTAALDIDMVAQLNTNNLLLTGISGTLLTMVDWLRTINTTTLQIADKGILAELMQLNQNTLNIADKGILNELVQLNKNTLNIADKGILAELMKLNDTMSMTPSDTGSSTAGPWTSAHIGWLLSNTADTDYNTRQTSQRVRIASDGIQDVKSELKSLNSKLRELTTNNFHQNKAIIKHNNDTADSLQRIEINGLDVRVE